MKTYREHQMQENHISASNLVDKFKEIKRCHKERGRNVENISRDNNKKQGAFKEVRVKNKNV